MMDRNIIMRGLPLWLFVVLLAWSLPASAQLPLVHVQLKVTGRTFRDNVDAQALEEAGTKTLVRVLSETEKFLRFSSTDGPIQLEFRLLSVGEEHLRTGDPRELGLFISAQGPGIQPGGQAYWIYRRGEAHGEPIGTVDDILEVIEQVARRGTNLQSLTRNLLSHITLGTDGSLKTSSQGKLQWYFPPSLNDACIVRNDTTFLVSHVGIVDNVELNPQVTVIVIGRETPANGNDTSASRRWVGVDSLPLVLSDSERQKLQLEIDQVKSDPSHMRVKEIFMFLYSPPARCDDLFSPSARNADGTGGT